MCSSCWIPSGMISLCLAIESDISLLYISKGSFRCNWSLDTFDFFVLTWILEWLEVYIVANAANL